MPESRSLEEVRAVLQHNRDALTREYNAVGTGIGVVDGRHSITVYLRSHGDAPPGPVSLDEVEVVFVVTGEIVPQRDGER